MLATLSGSHPGVCAMPGQAAPKQTASIGIATAPRPIGMIILLWELSSSADPADLRANLMRYERYPAASSCGSIKATS